MTDSTPRLRMFAGPNGSGKSTLKKVVTDQLPPDVLGIYVNADEIEQCYRRDGELYLLDYQVTTTAEVAEGYFQQSPLLPQERDPGNADKIRFVDGCLHLKELPALSYYAAVTADFIRNELLKAGVTFSFETVMSHHDKIELFKKAQSQGYRTYLYFVATDDPAINVSRVKVRVTQGGHDVPEEKIRERYLRSLDFLFEAIRYSNRAYIFDNSRDGKDRVWLAEVTDGKELEMKSEWMPAWFRKAVWDKIQPQAEGT